MVEMGYVQVRSGPKRREHVQQSYGIGSAGHGYQDTLGAFEQALLLYEPEYFFERVAHIVFRDDLPTAQAL